MRFIAKGIAGQKPLRSEYIFARYNIIQSTSTNKHQWSKGISTWFPAYAAFCGNVLQTYCCNLAAVIVALIVKLHPGFSRDYTGSLEVLLVLTAQLCQLSSLSHPFRTCFHVFDVQLERLCTISPSHDTQQQSNIKNGVSESQNDSLFIFRPETHYLKTGHIIQWLLAGKSHRLSPGLGASDQLKGLMDSCWASRLQWSDVISLGEKHVVSVEGCMAFHGHNSQL